MQEIFESLKKQLIVSCQSEGDDPFNKPEYILLFAQAAIMGGAKGLRTQGKANTEILVKNTQLPVIGLIKSEFPDGLVRITGSFGDVESLLETGCQIIAIDGTFRRRENLTGPEFISEVKKRYNCTVMADIATTGEGIACADFGADCVSTTLSGYTPETMYNPKDEPDYKLITRLSRAVQIPVIAEGKFNMPKFARHALEYGAHAVVVGTAITRPRVITSWFLDEMKNAIFENSNED